MPRRRNKSDEQRREQNREIKRERRNSDPGFREVEQARDTETRRQTRADSARREEEQARDTEARRQTRADSTRREVEQAQNTEARRQTRADSARREEEQARDTEARRQTRADSTRREVEQAQNTEARRQIRADSAQREAEQARDTKARRQTRADSAQREAEQARDREARRQTRADSARREEEQARDTEARRQTRADSTRREVEQAQNTEARRQIRANSAQREAEQARDTKARRQTRADSARREEEQAQNTEARRQIRADSTRREVEQTLNTDARMKRRKHNKSNWDYNFEVYQDLIKQSPRYVCSSCGGLWYEKSTTVVTPESLREIGLPDKFIASVLVVRQVNHRLCGTCKRSICKKENPTIPRLCLTNGFQFPIIPPALKDLSPLEERLVALRLPFMQIRLLGSERQSSLRGNVVNVENDLDVCAEVLPRRFDDMSTIQVQLMRRMRYQHPYLYETIRPFKVYKAAKYLVNTPLYQEQEVVLSDDWSGYAEEESMDFICTDETEPEMPEESETNQEHEDETITDLESEMQRGADETLIFAGSKPTFHGIRIAPGEGKTPIPLLQDTDAELLSFPSIYCGEKRMFTIKGVSYTDIAKSEIRRYDRRACHPTKLLYSFKRSFNDKVRQAVQVCLRKKTGAGRVTAKDTQSQGFVEGLFSRDDGYAIFKDIRSSPSYWKKKTQMVTAMVRQIGKCAFFITLSAAETRWAELLVTLKKLLKNEDITEEEALALPYEEKAELIRSDPVTCMRNFDNRYRALLNNILTPDGGLFAPHKLKDYFSRLEFQMRGSPHSHGLYWVDEAPTYIEGDEESDQACCEFIDKFITCERSEDGDMANLIGYQIHKHSHTCEKKSRRGKKCRFGFPKPPMKETKILTPLPKEYDPERMKDAECLFIQIQDKLNNYGRSFKEDIPFEEFINSLDTTEEEYILAVRSSIRRSQVFLRRQTSSIFVNGYNRKLLETWRANIDVQFVLDTYACAKYCVGYILKAQGGVSKLLRAAIRDVRRGNFSIRENLRKYAGVLINGSEISAQEAAAFILGISNTRCSRKDVFINTGPPDERTRILKSKKELKELGDTSLDIYCKGLVEHYSQRHEDLEAVCLAEFASLYEFSKKTGTIPSHAEDDRNLDEDDGFGNDEESRIEGEFLSQIDDTMEDQSASAIPMDVDDESDVSMDEPMPCSSSQASQAMMDVDSFISDEDITLQSPASSQPTPTKRQRDSSGSRKNKTEWFSLMDESGFVRKRRVQKIIRFRHYGKYQDPENYWREQLMLFVPWRDEDEELLSIDPIAKAEQNMEEILTNSKPYYYDRETDDQNLGLVMDELEQEFEENDEETPADIADDDENEEDDYVDCGIDDYQSNTTSRVEQFMPPKLVPDVEFLQVMRRLNEKQRRFVLHSLHLFKTSSQPFYNFLSGGAGVGKSEVVTAIVQCILRYSASLARADPKDIPVLVAAPTGKAAFNVFGMTLHCTFKLPPSQYPGQLCDMDDGVVNTVRIKFGKTQLFIIDEISMVSVRQFYEIDQRLRQIFATNEDFGGRSFLVVGHLRQLPPVAASHVFTPPSHLPLGDCVGNHLWNRFGLFELDQIMRQQGEFEFCKALNNMAEGEMDEDDIALIKSREISSEEEAPDDSVWLFETNDECKAHNAKVHERLQTEGALSVAVDRIEGNGTNKAKADLAAFAKTLNTQQSDGLPYETHLQVGAEYFVTTNIAVQDRLFNGATGSLKMIEYKTNTKGEKTPKRAWMDFRHPLIGVAKRTITKNYQVKNKIELKWVAIDKIKRNLSKTGRHRGLKIIRTQIPLVGSNGTTINKAQGSSLLCAVLAIRKNRRMPREKLYVGCSRPTTRNGLYIFGKFQAPSRPGPKDPVTLEMARLRSIPFVFSIKFLQDYDNSYEKIYFHNVQSFLLHHLDVQADHCAMSSNFIVFVEPMLLRTDGISFPNMGCRFRSNCQSARNSEGVVMFQKAGGQDAVENPTLIKDITTSGHCLFLKWKSSGATAVAMYKSPKYPKLRFVFKLQGVLREIVGPCLFVGDINIDLQTLDGRAVISAFRDKGLESKLDIQKASTDGGSHIDCCFSNIVGCEAWFYESYYSYHKPICIVWKK